METKSGYRVFGMSNSFGIGNHNVLVLDLSPDGTLLGQKAHGLPDDDLRVNPLTPAFSAVTASGGAVVVGATGEGSLRITRLETSSSEDAKCSFVVNGTAKLESVLVQPLHATLQVSTVSVRQEEPSPIHTFGRTLSIAATCTPETQRRFAEGRVHPASAEPPDPDLPAIRAAAKLEADKEAFRAKVQDLFLNRKFDELDALASKVIQSRERFTPLQWKITALHDALALGTLQVRAGDEAPYRLAEEWAAHSPKSAAALVALAAAYVDRAWGERGPGYENKVTEQGNEAFERYLEQAKKVLRERKDVAAADPHYFVMVSRATLGENWPELVRSAGPAAAYPPLYTSIGAFLRPQWGGTVAEYKQLAETAVANTRADLGEAMYAYLTAVYMDTAQSHGSDTLTQLGWDRISKGFVDWTARVPGAIDAWHYYLEFAIVADEKEVALRLLARPELTWNHYAARVWGRERYAWEIAEFKKLVAHSGDTAGAWKPLPPMPPEPPHTRTGTLLLVDAELPGGEHRRLNAAVVRTEQGLVAVSGGNLPPKLGEVTVSVAGKPDSSVAIDERRIRREDDALVIRLEPPLNVPVEALEPRAGTVAADDPLMLVFYDRDSRASVWVMAGKPAEEDEITITRFGGGGVAPDGVLGAPLLDPSGHVAAVIIRASDGTLGARSVQKLLESSRR